MNEETGVAELGYFFGKEFYSFGRVAEDDGLVDVQLCKQSVEAVKFLFFLKICVVLCYTFQSEFLHEVYELRLFYVLLLERLDFYGVGCRKQHDLFVFGK